MDGACNEFLAHAAVAGKQDRRVAWCALANESIHALHRPRFADQQAPGTFRCSIVGPGVSKLGLEVFEIFRELFRVHRDIEIVRNAHAHRPGCVADVSRGTHQVNLHDFCEVHLLQQIQRTFAVNLFVEQCDFRHTPGQGFPGPAQVPGAFDGIAARPEYFGKRDKAFTVVIDDKGSWHGTGVRVAIIRAASPRRSNVVFYRKSVRCASLARPPGLSKQVTHLPAARPGSGGRPAAPVRSGHRSSRETMTRVR